MSKFFRILLAGGMLMLASLTAPAATIYAGFEDTPFVWGDNDYNDQVLKITSLSNITLTGVTGGWRPLTDPVNENGTDFMDNPSFDGPQSGSLHFMTGSGSFTGNIMSPGIGAGNLLYWGNGDGTSDSSVSLESATSLAVVFLLELTGNFNATSLGWFYLSTDTILNQAFAGNQTAGATATITTDGSPIGLYAMIGSDLFRSTVTPSGGNNPFVFYQQAQGDVPEPMTSLLFGAGLVAIAAFRRRK